MWLFHIFMKGSSVAALNTRSCQYPTTPPNKPREMKGMLQTYPFVERYILQPYATDNVIDETDGSFRRYTQRLTILQMQSAKALTASSQGCETWNSEHILKPLLIEEFYKSVRHSLRFYCITHPGLALYDLARHKASLRALQKRANGHSEKWADQRQNT